MRIVNVPEKVKLIFQASQDSESSEESFGTNEAVRTKMSEIGRYHGVKENMRSTWTF